MSNTNYNEIFHLRNMLIEHGIPHGFGALFDGHQISYPVGPHDPGIVMDAVQHCYSYGHSEDLLEIMGLLTPEEADRDEVLGYLSAEDVFARIQKHWEEHRGKE